MPAPVVIVGKNSRYGPGAFRDEVTAVFGVSRLENTGFCGIVKNSSAIFEKGNRCEGKETDDSELSHIWSRLAWGHSKLDPQL